MQPKPPPSAESAELRRSAEARLREQRPEAGRARTEADTQRLVHELQVHQIELEMQNEELRHARNEMEAGLEKYSDLYDFAPVGYLSLDRDGGVREANLTCASLLGIERSRLLNRSLGFHVTPAELPAFNTFLTRVFASKVRESCELTLLRERKPPVEVRIDAALAASGQECRAVVEDITESKRAELDRLTLNKLESTRILAGGIAHDFNNLLTVMVLELELALESAPAGGALAHRLEGAKHAALAARGLTQQLVTFAHGGAAVRRPTRLPELIPAAVRMALSGSRVACEFSLPDDLWVVEVDAGQIGQVIRNLVLNGREAMPEGGLLAVRAENAVLGSHQDPPLPPGDYVRVSIADRGGGITKELLAKVFDPYYSTKQRGEQKGMGLGLTISHTIIQKHGGGIAVESQPAVGTTFHVYLPACRKWPEEAKAPDATPLSRRGRMLVMEEEDGVREVVQVWLQRLGHEVDLVADGGQAVAAWRRARQSGCPYDVALLDLTVRGGIGGQEVVQALLQIDPTAKAIVMSGYPNDPVVLAPERYGFQGVLVKPFGSESLRIVLARVLGPGGPGGQ